MARIHKRASAQLDLVDHFVYLAETASLDTAERFLSCAENSFRDLATHPFLGPELTLAREDLKGIRKWRVKDFVTS